jgi:hypothetical protein
MRFNLFTVFVCMTTLAVVTAFCVKIPVKEYETRVSTFFVSGMKAPATKTYQSVASRHKPSIVEFGVRVAWAWPLTVAATLALIWTTRRLRRYFNRVQPIPILLALVVVLGFVSEARAFFPENEHDYRITVASQCFGFTDYSVQQPGMKGRERTFRLQGEIYLGPLGACPVPFTATQGLVGFCMIVIGMVALVTMFTFRWKRKSSTSPTT